MKRYNQHNNTQLNGSVVILSVSNNPCMLSVVTLTVIMLSVVAPQTDQEVVLVKLTDVNVVSYITFCHFCPSLTFMGILTEWSLVRTSALLTNIRLG
jgi:hypothetical protein